jgi:aarF domain-containing kinase
MRSALTIGRLCLRQAPKTRPTLQCRVQLLSRRFHGNGGKSHFRTPPHVKGLLFAAAVSLSPAAFVQLSEKDNGGTEQTAEGRMLEASREEIKKKVADDVHGFRRLRANIFYFADVYIWEPICTGLRFLHLVLIFVPVMVTVPALWVGKRDPKRDNERWGSLWWYWFLVKSMERAGPAFIKVWMTSSQVQSNADHSSLDNGQLLDQISSQRRCAKSCLLCIPMLQLTLSTQRNES